MTFTWIELRIGFLCFFHFRHAWYSPSYPPHLLITTNRLRHKSTPTPSPPARTNFPTC